MAIAKSPKNRLAETTKAETTPKRRPNSQNQKLQKIESGTSLPGESKKPIKKQKKYDFTRSVFLTNEYDLFLLAYCEWLARNQLYAQRASFLKVLSNPLVTDNGVMHYERRKKKLQEMPNCDWCKQKVNGLMLICDRCGHGGHWQHRIEISQGELPTTCPRNNCNCECYEAVGD